MDQVQTEDFSKIEIDITSPKFAELFLEAVDHTFSTLGVNASKTFLLS